MLDVERSRRSRASFTLVELLTAIAILIIIVGILFSAFEGASTATVRNESRIEVNQVVRAVLDQMTRDMERMVGYRDPICINLRQEGNTGYLVNPNPDYPTGIPTNTLFMYVDLPGTEAEFGNPVNVGYRIAFTNSLNRFVLWRGDDSAVDATSGPCCTDWWDNTGGTCPFTATADNLTYWKLLSENVLGVDFRYYTNSVEYTGGPASGADQYRTNWNFNTNIIPYSIRVTIYSIDTPNYNRAVLAGFPSGAGTNIVLRNMKTYSARVYLPRSTQNP